MESKAWDKKGRIEVVEELGRAKGMVRKTLKFGRHVNSKQVF